MSKTSKRFQLFIMVSVLLLAGWTVGSVHASSLVPQTWLPGDDLFGQFAFTTPLPIFGPGYNRTLPRVNALQHPFLKVTMKEIDQQVLPQGTFNFPSVGNVTLGPTRVWTYEIRDAFRGTLLGPAHWPGVTVEAERFFPTTMTYVNELPRFNKDNPNGPGLVQGLVSVDKTIHWANPLNSDCMDNPNGQGCSEPFIGSPPATVHLHGGEVPPGSDGGPDSWFTPDGKTGPGYRTLFNAGPGKAVYLYPNFQEPGTLFFHDHALGATRTNLYSGMAAFYFIRGPLTEPRNLPKGAYEIEMAIQDRQFDTKGQLVFPDGSDPASNLNGTPPNPDIHPFWIPEFFGDVAIVNGAPWPVLNVEPRRYLFRIVDGSNARFYNLKFGDTLSGEPSPPVYAIGSDDAYLDAPVPVSTVFIAPGERAYVIVDFTNPNLNGKTITVTNDAPAPYPDGVAPGDSGQIGIGSIMQFKVTAPS